MFCQNIYFLILNAYVLESLAKGLTNVKPLNKRPEDGANSLPSPQLGSVCAGLAPARRFKAATAALSALRGTKSTRLQSRLARAC